MDDYQELPVEGTNSQLTDRNKELKMAVNNLVWMHAPGKTTLDDADDRAMKIIDIIMAE